MASTKEEYQLLVDAEESEIFIISLVEQVVQRSQEVLFEKHIESQVLPYAVQFAKQTIDEIVEWEFFRRDPGDIDPATWEPDTEPEPAVIDSWAPCAMPMRKPPIIPKKATPPPLETAQSESMQSLRSSFSEESEPVLEKRPSVVGSAPLKGSMMSVSSSKEKKISIRDSRMDMGSATSLATSNTSIMRRRAASGSASRRHTAKDSNQQVPLSATQLAEMAIQEENKILLQRIRNMEKDSGKPVEWSYDHEGRVVMVKKGPPAKTSAFG
ncbi:hypothetical protein DFS34DRAFT_70852 [Phlyctochytrium arcticum]|nr:hypothetical protein DFS34DRAFT_70852 [Phlyctochytrium arcticum]